MRHCLPAGGDILRHQWSKLMLNVGVNQATAVYGTDYSGAGAGPARQAMLAAMEEARAVAAAQGVSLTERDVEGWLELLPLTPGYAQHAAGCAGAAAHRGGAVRGHDHTPGPRNGGCPPR